MVPAATFRPHALTSRTVQLSAVSVCRAHNRCSGFTPLTPAMRQIEPKKPARWLDWSTWPSTASPSACDVNAKRQRPPPPPLTADIATTTVAGATTVAAAARASASTTCLLLHGTSSSACERRHRQRLQQHGRQQRRETRLRRALMHAPFAAREAQSSYCSRRAVRAQSPLRSRNE